jgi:hypothetical protein
MDLAGETLPQSRSQPEQKLRFTTRRITVTELPSGQREVNAYVSGPLAVHCEQVNGGEKSDRYVVTHIATGMTAEHRGMRKARAFRLAKLLLTHPDHAVWTDGEFGFGVKPSEEWLLRAFAVLTAAREEAESEEWATEAQPESASEALPA